MQVYYSPQLGSGNKNSSSFRNSGAYTSPGTPDYGDNVLGFQKGWCSERVPLSNSSRRHIGAAALLPFNSGRTLPSKWDDAERWITSPVSGFGVCKIPATPPQRRPKAKSGPLGGTGSPGVGYFSNYSPAVPVLHGLNTTKNFLAGSPLTTGVLVPDGLPFGQAGSINPAHFNNYGMVQSVYFDSEGVASRRDMATQMSPATSSTDASSPRYIPLPCVRPSSQYSARVEVRDVQVDKGVPMGNHSKRHRTRIKNNRSPEANDLSLTWNSTQGERKSSKIQKEEARITAWENLQNAKAEASMRKLEMKLVKKKSASLDKILNKHREAQMKAEEMRKNMESGGISSRSSNKFRSIRKSVLSSFKGCFHHRHDL